MDEAAKVRTAYPLVNPFAPFACHLRQVKDVRVGKNGKRACMLTCEILFVFS